MVDNKYQINLFIFLTIFILLWNFWYNAIWIPNESFYAEAVREMFESKNFLDIYYNYEPRFNKPPLTYWSIALSAFIFGLNEFAIRLPIVLMSIGSISLTYMIAKILFDKKVAIFSFFVMAFSFQFVINSRYASPEVPLLFFFTLTLYFFLKGYKEKKDFYIYLSYISLGLTILTKGYPYLLVLSGIIGFYLLVESNFSFKEWINKILKIKIYIGLPIALTIGFSWILYMHFKFGNQFWTVYNEETIERAFGEHFKFSDLFFYLIVILWGFLPYSLTFYFSFLDSYKRWFKDFSFIFSWVFVMFAIFTIAKGKIPTYFIQVHPALSIFAGYYLANYKPEGFKKYIWNFSLLFPTLIIVVLNFLIVYLFKLDYLYYLVSLFPILYFLRYKEIRLLPFTAILTTFLIFTVSLLVKVEKYRPYKEIGYIINYNVPDRKIPLIIEGRFFHNLPFYAKRKVLRDYSLEGIEKFKKENGYLLALVNEDSLKKIDNVKVIWSGYLYSESESRFAIFLTNIYNIENGKSSKFVKMYLVSSLF